MLLNEQIASWTDKLSPKVVLAGILPPFLKKERLIYQEIEASRAELLRASSQCT